MAKSTGKIAELEEKLNAALVEIDKLKALVRKVQKEVKVTIEGPRLSSAFVEYQDIPLIGQYTRKGSKIIELEPSEIPVSVGVKGMIGTDVTLTIELNGKKKEEKWTMEKEQQLRDFSYTFQDFNLSTPNPV